MNPIPMILHCPSCGLQHIDAPDMHEVTGSEGRVHEAGWTNPPHRSHLCAGCGCIWRPADVPTVGVASIATRGKDDDHTIVPRDEVPLRWNRIESAPKDNKRSLYLAKFNAAGEMIELDFNGGWESDHGSWEMPSEYWYWASENGIKEPTHWAYQDSENKLRSAS